MAPCASSFLVSKGFPCSVNREPGVGKRQYFGLTAGGEKKEGLHLFIYLFFIFQLFFTHICVELLCQILGSGDPEAKGSGDPLALRA